MDYSKLFNDRALQQHLQLSQKGEALAAGLQELSNAPDEEHSYTSKEKRNNKRYDELLRLLTQTRYALDGFIHDMDIRLIEAQRELAAFKDMQQERLALDECIKILESGGILDRNPDGNL